MKYNDKFIPAAVEKIENSSPSFDPSRTKIFFLCRSGTRSMHAARALTKEADFKQCFNVLPGFEGHLDDNKHRNTKEGWKFENYPFTQS